MKFRAWDKEFKIFRSWENLMSIRYNERWFIDNTDKNYINCIFTDSDLILELFTGLVDKSGKEIYDGDIVKFSGHYFGDTFEEESIELIIWEDASYPWKLLQTGYFDGPEWCEVIGNVHESN